MTVINQHDQEVATATWNVMILKKPRVAATVG
jgi:hypothetical protein